jgi:N-acetylneuraminic acid mutarotase
MKRYVVFALACMVVVILSGTFAVKTVNASGDSWQTKKPIPIQTGFVSGAAVVDGKIYAMGSGINLEYDTATDNWRNRTPMPTTRSWFAITYYDNKIYVIGGTTTGFAGDQTGTNEVYDPSTNTWQSKASMPTIREGAKANVANGKIYVMGGRTGGEHTTVNITECYDPISDIWTTVAPLIFPVDGYSSAVIDNKIYVMGGQDEFDPQMNVPYTQIYDPQTNTWSQGVSMPVSTLSACAGATTGINAPKRIYVIGGSVGFGGGSNDNFVYNPETDGWTNATAMPTARYSPAIAVVNDSLYVLGGGQSLHGLPTNEQYTPIGYGTVPSPSPPSPSPSPELPSAETHNEFSTYVIAAAVITLSIVAIAIVILKRKKQNCGSTPLNACFNVNRRYKNELGFFVASSKYGLFCIFGLKFNLSLSVILLQLRLLLLHLLLTLFSSRSPHLLTLLTYSQKQQRQHHNKS